MLLPRFPAPVVSRAGPISSVMPRRTRQTIFLASTSIATSSPHGNAPQESSTPFAVVKVKGCVRIPPRGPDCGFQHPSLDVEIRPVPLHTGGRRWPCSVPVDAVSTVPVPTPAAPSTCRWKACGPTCGSSNGATVRRRLESAAHDACQHRRRRYTRTAALVSRAETFHAVFFKMHPPAG
jgi:hypothetical protein